MSRTLQINGSATIDAATWDIHFENLSSAKLSGSASVTTAPTIKEYNGVKYAAIGDYEVILTKPGDKVVYEFDVVNNGSLNAKLSTLTKQAIPTCTSLATTPVESDATLVCENLTYTLTYSTEDGALVAEQDTLNSKETKHLVLTLAYKDTATELPTDNVKVEGLNITMLYEQN